MPRTPRPAASAALDSLLASAPPTRASMTRPWACTGHDPSCTKAYVEKKALDKHIKLKHEDGGAVCPHCNKIQPDTRVKPEHLKRCKREMEEKEEKERAEKEIEEAQAKEIEEAKAKEIEEAVRMGREAAEALLKQWGY